MGHPTATPDSTISPATSVYAAVLVDAGGSASRRPFDYAVPAHLAGKIEPGSLVVVPFGRRFMRGVVLGLLTEPAVPDPKPIRQLYPGAALADPHAGQLAAFVARRYAASLIEAYRAVLPPAIAGKVGRRTTVGDASEVYLSSRRPEETYYCAAPGALISDHRLRNAPRQAQLLAELVKAGRPVRRDEVPMAGEVLQRAMAGLLAKGLAIAAGEVPQAIAPQPVTAMLGRTGDLVLTEPQSRAIDAIRAALASQAHREFLLLGVTGSGKTEVYLQAITDVAQAGGQALVLVPEIALTPQTISRFEARFPGQVALLHSRLSDRERARAWRRLGERRALIAVGARSALFAPLPDLRLIVVDEEHEPSYKQEELPRYDAREVVRERARLAGAVLLYGSATPSLEVYWRTTAPAGTAGGDLAPRPQLLAMPHRVEAGVLPAVELVDLRRELETGNRSVLSRKLQAEITGCLERSEQAILFLNRRGHSTFVLCRECGYVARCPHCDVALVLHGQDGVLRCHHCGHEMTPPTTCPTCGGTRIRYFGTGTERVEAQVREMFPAARIARLDSDVAAQRGRAEAILTEFAQGRTDILIGTQMVGKGLDFPGVTLVGVIAADIALNFPDFRAAERTFGLVTQVAGRAGRGARPGLVIVQSYSPEHYSLQYAARQDYQGFAAVELAHRRELCYPPYTHMALFRVMGPAEEATAAAAHAARAILDDLAAKLGLRGLVGPSPAPLYRLQGRYRWNIVLSDTDPQRLADACSAGLDAMLAAISPPLRVSADVDPQAML